MLETIDLANVLGGAGGSSSRWATGGFWTGRTREDEELAERSGSRLGAGGFWTGRTRDEQDDPKGWEARKERMRNGEDFR